MQGYEYYELKRIMVPADNSGDFHMASAAFRDCGLCGECISSSGGPGSGSICIECGDLVKTKGSIKRFVLKSIPCPEGFDPFNPGEDMIWRGLRATGIKEEPSGLGAAVTKARGITEPPSVPVHFGATSFQLSAKESGLLDRFRRGLPMDSDERRFAQDIYWYRVYRDQCGMALVDRGEWIDVFSFDEWITAGKPLPTNDL